MDHLFEKASRNKFRFESPKGFLTVEDLWDLPLSSGKQVSLNSVAIEVNTKLKAASDENFVTTSSNPERKLREEQLELLKYIISVRQAENAKAVKLLQSKAEAEKLRDILAARGEQALNSLSDEDIRNRLAEIENQ